MKCLKYCTINKRCWRCETLYCTTNKGSKTMYVGGVKSGVCGFYTTVYRVILLMSEVSKVDRKLSIQSNVTHVKGVKSSSINTIRAVVLCMSKVSKEVQNGLTHLCS